MGGALLPVGKVELPIPVTPSDTVILVMPVQPKMILLPIYVTLPGMVISVRPVEYAKACVPILVTQSLIVIFFRLLYSENA